MINDIPYGVARIIFMDTNFKVSLKLYTFKYIPLKNKKQERFSGKCST